MSHPKGYVDADFLRFISNLLNPAKQRSYALMQIQPGHTVLDLGCGPGTDTIPLASLVTSAGQIIGADYDMEMINIAERHAVHAGVNGWVRHERTDATSLPFADNYFDSCRSERLFQHLPEPALALSEMTRVTKPGGRVIVLDTDWGTLSTDSDETDIERRLARFLSESALHNGYSGRTLHRLFKQQNLTDISIEIFPITITDYTVARLAIQSDKIEHYALEAGIVSKEELNRWRTSLEKADAEDTYFCSANLMLLTGNKS